MNILESVLLFTLWSQYDDQLAPQKRPNAQTHSVELNTNDDAVQKPSGQELADAWNAFKVCIYYYVLTCESCERIIANGY